MINIQRINANSNPTSSPVQTVPKWKIEDKLTDVFRKCTICETKTRHHCVLCVLVDVSKCCVVKPKLFL